MTVYTLSSTNINQSAPNLVKLYVIQRSLMSSIMDLIRPELSKLSAFELENLPYFTCYSPVFGAGGVPHSLSGAHRQDYAS